MSMLIRKRRLLLVFLILAMMLVTSVALAAPQDSNKFENTPYKQSATNPQVYQGPSTVVMLFQLFVGTGVVVGLAYVVIKIYKKNTITTSQSQFINVVDQYTFGMNKGVFITEIGGRVLVLGVTEHNINVVTEINDQKLIDEIKDKAQEQKLQDQSSNPYMQLIKGLIPNKIQNNNSFHSHIQYQINKLQGMVNSSPDLKGREDDQNVN